MKSPSVKSLVSHFGVAKEQALLIKRLCDAAGKPRELEALIDAHCPETAAYARSCSNSPYSGQMWRRTMVLHAVDRIIGTCGVEPIGDVDMHQGPPYEYCNTGDSYAATLIYRRATDNLYVGSWATIAERTPSSADC